MHTRMRKMILGVKSLEAGKPPGHQSSASGEQGGHTCKVEFIESGLVPLGGDMIRHEYKEV
jgi:hypothetical protein